MKFTIALINLVSAFSFGMGQKIDVIAGTYTAVQEESCMRYLLMQKCETNDIKPYDVTVEMKSPAEICIQSPKDPEPDCFQSYEKHEVSEDATYHDDTFQVAKLTISAHGIDYERRDETTSTDKKTGQVEDHEVLNYEKELYRQGETYHYKDGGDVKGLHIVKTLILKKKN